MRSQRRSVVVPVVAVCFVAALASPASGQTASAGVAPATPAVAPGLAPVDLAAAAVMSRDPEKAPTFGGAWVDRQGRGKVAFHEVSSRLMGRSAAAA